MTVSRSLIVVPITGLVCLVVATGCEMASVDGSIQGQTFEPSAGDTTSPAQPEPSDPSTSVTNEPGFGGDYIAGNKADAGAEIYRVNWNGGDVRCLGADYDNDGYFMSDIIDDAGALTLGGDGTATARNFISPRTGLHYKFVGYREQSSGSDLITQNPHTVVKHGTFRCYWNPVEGL